MPFPDNILVAMACVITAIVAVRNPHRLMREDTDLEEGSETLPEDHYSFVALIDVVFTNGAKKTCTGTIIHDNVVITAAHCFNTNYNGEVIQPELTASFVVIGTKKMFNTGYEQYLPIERVIVHPKYKGWTADLALVYTFAGMTSDKPGRIVPLATEKTNTPVDSDVTVFSWGICKNDEKETASLIIETPDSVEETEEGDIRETENIKSEEINLELLQNGRQRQRRKKHRHRSTKRKRKNKRVTHVRARNRASNSKVYRQLSSAEKNKGNRDTEYGKRKVSRDQRRQKKHWPANNMVSFYRNNWRRKMGDQQNQLKVEVFGFVNIQTCKKLVGKAMPSSYRIKNTNEVLCYASEDHYVTEEDSGAPAMRRGRLVAVTVGGANFDGERVAIGMKMTCFCTWIAENLPKSGTQLQCCKNCCELKRDVEGNSKEASFRHKHRKDKSL